MQEAGENNSPASANGCIFSPIFLNLLSLSLTIHLTCRFSGLLFARTIT